MVKITEQKCLEPHESAELAKYISKVPGGRKRIARENGIHPSTLSSKINGWASITPEDVETIYSYNQEPESV
jgi:DNA-binding transcriptional regulator YdaS (Cro superfamily)